MERIYLNNSKIALNMAQLKANSSFDFANLTEKEIITKVQLSTDEPNSNVELSVEDQIIQDIVYSAMQDGEEYISVGNIAKGLIGNTKRPSDALKHTIRERIRLQSIINIIIDASDEFRARKIDKGVPCIYSGRLMPLTPVIGEDGKINEYHVDAMLPLLNYAEAINQMISVPIELIDSGVLESCSTDYWKLKRELIRRIEVIRNHNNRMSNSVIRYMRFDPAQQRMRGIFCDAGINVDLKQQRKKKSMLHALVRLILDGFKSVGYIKDYSVTTNGRSVTGVKLDVGKKDIKKEKDSQ